MANNKAGDKASGAAKDQDAQSQRSSQQQQQQQKQPTASNVYPNPPVFYRSYGKNAAPKHELAVSLEPPKIPEGAYMTFGEFWTPEDKRKLTELALRTRTLKEEGREQLFEDAPEGQPLDYAGELRKVSKLALEKYCALMDALCDMNLSMTDSRNKADEFETVYVNLLYLVNQLRPAQGRQILINMLKRQLERRQETAANLRRLVAEGEARIRETAQAVKENATVEDI
ncbi:Mediator of RNA polymerase II transcription subunit 7 [Hondaea fermentalgiana]|uniref:Mediator of RNA polymerase II transcription subunit 7 n=1 Tax=Hondaea fermentalgiana TaxID=2315210 RepID=A0A2R5GMY0_9STRA|nr:Mediator of RNA polymerase II transcription subunit 7 [Hondaea fermentalgiana]|eukprot:GBG31975.1 Mediator of RNA polymerase II transcription subunit 7 [Hondaea fermentalgiana]